MLIVVVNTTLLSLMDGQEYSLFPHPPFNGRELFFGHSVASRKVSCTRLTIFVLPYLQDQRRMAYRL
jgi:hypothetical protein